MLKLFHFNKLLQYILSFYCQVPRYSFRKSFRSNLFWKDSEFEERLMENQAELDFYSFKVQFFFFFWCHVLGASKLKQNFTIFQIIGVAFFE